MSSLFTALRPDLAAEAVDPVSVLGVSAGSRADIAWRCPRCAYVWAASPAARVAGRECPACLGRGRDGSPVPGHADPTYSAPMPSPCADLVTQLTLRARVGVPATGQAAPSLVGLPEDICYGHWAAWPDHRVAVRILESTAHHHAAGFTARRIAEPVHATAARGWRLLTVWRDNLHACLNCHAACLRAACGVENWEVAGVGDGDLDWLSEHSPDPVPPGFAVLAARDGAGRTRVAARLSRYRGGVVGLHPIVSDGAAVTSGAVAAMVGAARDAAVAEGAVRLTVTHAPWGDYSRLGGRAVAARVPAWRMAGGPGQRTRLRGAAARLPRGAVHGYSPALVRVAFDL